MVLGYQQSAMTAASDGGYISSATPLPSLSSRAETTALVVWVNTENDFRPLQTTGGWLN